MPQRERVLSVVQPTHNITHDYESFVQVYDNGTAPTLMFGQDIAG